MVGVWCDGRRGLVPGLLKWKTPESKYWKGQLTLSNAQIWGSQGFYPGTTDVRSVCE